MSNLGYLFAAYAVVWVGIFVYMLWLSGRMSSVSRDLERLTQEWSQHIASKGQK